LRYLTEKELAELQLHAQGVLASESAHMVEDIFHNNKNIFIETCCHYSFSNPEVMSIKQNNPDIDKIIKIRLREKIRELLCIIK